MPVDKRLTGSRRRVRYWALPPHRKHPGRLHHAVVSWPMSSMKRRWVVQSCGVVKLGKRPGTRAVRYVRPHRTYDGTFIVH